MSTTIAKANPKVGFVSLGCPKDAQSIRGASNKSSSISLVENLWLRSAFKFNAPEKALARHSVSHSLRSWALDTDVGSR